MITLRRMILVRAAMMLLITVLTATTAWAADFNINSAADWDTFRTNIANGETYSGKTVSLNADISVGLMVCDDNHSFQGTFEGNGHKLTISQSGNVDFIAPFSHVSGNAVFRNLTVAGSVNSNTKSYAAGLIGHLFGSVTIENCTSALSITSAGGAGGFVGLCEHTVTFINCKSSAVITSAGGNNGGFVGFSRSSGYAISFAGCIFNGKLLQKNSEGSGAGFIGWKGDAKTVTITNCLYAPASLSSGQSYASGSIFCNQHNDQNPATITNSYYLTAIGTAQGKQALSITAGEKVTVAHAGNATVYNVSGITAYKNGNTQLPGLLYNNVLYAGNQDQVSLNLTNTATGAPSGYQYNYKASGGTLSGNSNPYTLTMPNADVTITAALSSTHQPVSVSYVDAKGTSNTANAIALDGTETNIGSEGTQTWYFVGLPTVNYDHSIYLSSGDVILILADGCTMNVGTSEAPLNEWGCSGLENGNNLTIYGQSLNTGCLNINISSDSSSGISTQEAYVQHGGNVNINAKDSGIIADGNIVYLSEGGESIITGGTVTIDGGSLTIESESNAIHARSDITINGGQVNATATSDDGIWSGGNITLDWTHASDRIYANSYVVSYGQTITIAEGKYFKDANSGNVYCGNVGSSINGKTLQPATKAEYVAYVFAQNVSGSGTSQKPYVINTTAGWNAFCDMIEIGETFSSKIVKLGANITVTRMAGSNSDNNKHAFSGVFNGQNNTLTFNCTAASSNYVAPFGYVKGGNSASSASTISNLNVVTTITANDYRHVAGLIALQEGHVNVTDCNTNVTLSTTKGTNNPSDLYPAGLVSQTASSGKLTISGCTITGTIATDGKYAAGMVGIVQGSATITDCVSSVTLKSSMAGDGTHGGFVGIANAATTITGSIFNGKLLTVGETATGNCGGFVGWGNGTITNCLYAPATLADGENEVVAGTGDYPSRTFGRDNASVTNCYYTRALGTAQGKQQRSITAGSNVTINGIALTGNTTTYSVSGITAYSNGGLSLGNTLYYGNGDKVSLTLSNTPPASYGFNGYTTTGGALTGTDNPYTLTMPDANVEIGAEFISLAVAYIDENGVEQQCTEYTLISDVPQNDDDTRTLTAGQWYVVNSNVSIYYGVNIDGSGAANIILCDGYSCNIIATSGRKAIEGSVNIYGQNLGTGTLDLKGAIGYYDGSSDGYYAQPAISGNIAVYGGIVNASKGENKGLDCSYYAIIGDVICSHGKLAVNSDNGNAINGNVNFSSGELTANGEIWGNVNLSWSNATDRFYASSIDGTVKVKEGKAFTSDGTDIYSGTIASGSIAGKTLQPAVAVTLADGITAGSGIISSGDGSTGSPQAYYAKVGQTVTVDASNATAPAGYTVGGITVAPTVEVTAGDNGTYSFTIPATDVTVSADNSQLRSTHQAVSVSYVDANGTEHTANAIALDGTETKIGSEGTQTWYFVGLPTVSFNHSIYLNDGNVTLILADGCTMNVGTSEAPLSGWADYALDSGNSLTIYGQSHNSGYLNINTSDDNSIGIVSYEAYTQHGGNVNINSKFYGINIPGKTEWITESTPIKVGGTVTIDGGTLTINADNAAIDANSDITISGGIVSATSKYSSAGMWSGTGNITLDWTNATDRIFASYYDANEGTVRIKEGKAFIDEDGTLHTSANVGTLNGKTLQPAVTVTLAEGITAIGTIGSTGSPQAYYAKVGATVTIAAAKGYTISDPTVTAAGNAVAVTAGSNGTYSFTVPAADVTVQATVTELPSVAYIDENGEEQTKKASEYTVLTGSETTLVGGWYVVLSDISYNNGITFSGNAHLILGDGKTMTVNYNIDDLDAIRAGNLTIYGQSAGTGKLNATGDPGGEADGINASSVTINGGQVTAFGSTSGIYASGSVTINGGQVTATGYENGGIWADWGKITLGWNRATDFIHVNSYDGNISIKEGKDFIDEDGTLHTSTYVGNLGGKTLRPNIMTLFDEASTSQWMTWCGHDAWTVPDDCTVYTVGSVGDATVTLEPLSNPHLIPAYTPVIVVRNNTDGAVTATFSGCGTGTDGVQTADGTTGCAFYGTTTELSTTDFAPYYTFGQTYVLYNGMFLLYDTNNGVPANRCWLNLSAPAAARLDINFSETTSLNDKGKMINDKEAAAWYTLDGRKLDGKPAKKGVYVNNGNKTVIK